LFLGWTEYSIKHTQLDFYDSSLKFTGLRGQAEGR
jgi:hypothetical protein